MAVSFTPPTIKLYSDDLLFGRYGFTTGVSVVKVNGTYTETMTPWLGEVAELTEGVDWFQGGRTYAVDDDIADALEADGFTLGGPIMDPTDSPVYGAGTYGDGIYGS